MSSPSSAVTRLARHAERSMNSRDTAGFISLVTEDVEFVPLLAAIDGGSYCGHEGVRRWLTSVWEAWHSYRVEFGEIAMVAKDVGTLEFEIDLQGRASGVEVKTAGYMAVELAEDGRARWWKFFAERPAALAAAHERAQGRP